MKIGTCISSFTLFEVVINTQLRGTSGDWKLFSFGLVTTDGVLFPVNSHRHLVKVSGQMRLFLADLGQRSSIHRSKSTIYLAFNINPHP